jgi:uridine kinase
MTGAVRQLVSVSGIDGCGKSTMGRRLRAAMGARGFPAVLLHVDDFRRKCDWTRTDRSGGDLYLEEYFDVRAIDACVDAFLAGHDRVDRPRFDPVAEAVDGVIEVDLRGAAALIVEGVFTRRLARADDYFQLYLLTSFEEGKRRMIERRDPPWRSISDFEHRIEQRYFAAQRRYLVEQTPEAKADVVVDNEDFLRPRLIRASFDRLAAALVPAVQAVLPPA